MTKKLLKKELVETVRTILRKTASNEKLGFQTTNPASGYGLIDIEKAVLMVKDLRIEK